MTVTSSRACAWALELVILKIGTGGITWIRHKINCSAFFARAYSGYITELVAVLSVLVPREDIEISYVEEVL